MRIYRGSLRTRARDGRNDFATRPCNNLFAKPYSVYLLELAIRPTFATQRPNECILMTDENLKYSVSETKHSRIFCLASKWLAGRKENSTNELASVPCNNNDDEYLQRCTKHFHRSFFLFYL